jgi:hypothetical protein
MESKKINQLATEMAPAASDLTIIGDPITGVSKKITLLQLAGTIGAGADLQQVTDNGATTTNPIAIGGLTITGLATGVLKSDSGVITSVPFGAANGVATLGGDGKVPSIQLPSYVDDVVEVANFAALPVTGETGKLYITLDNNKVYRWTGSIYVEIAANNAVWGAITGTLSNQTDLQSALNAKQNTITLTTTGTSGASTLVGSTLNIPNYSTDLSGYVPYTGATANVNLGTFDLTADVITGATGSFASSGGSNTFAINHSSGSGIALNITKGGNGEGLYINKTSGSGNAATIIGTLNATTLVKSGGTSSQFLKADGSVDSNSYVTIDTTQTITGDKTFNGVNVYNGVNTFNTYQTRFSLGIAINQTLSGGAVGSHTVIGANVNGLNVNFPAGGYNSLNFASTSVGNTYTFPNATGTIALTSDIPSLTGYVPYTGATANVNLGTFDLTADALTTDIANVNQLKAVGSSGISFNSNSGTQVALMGAGGGAGTTFYGGIIGTSATFSSLTSGYITRAGTSGILQNSLIYDTGTRIAIGGTSATDGVLTVQSDSGQFCIQSNTTPAKQLQIGYDHVANNSYLQSLNQGVAFTTLILQPSGGNVGIGTSTTNAKLDIKTSGNGLSFSSSYISSDNSVYGNALLISHSDGITRLMSTYVGTGINSNLTFWTTTSAGSQSERLRITSGGNIGIGTSSPVDYSGYRSLHIMGASSTSSAILYLTNSTSSIRGLFFAEGSANRVTLGSQSDHPLTFVTNDAERMRIDEVGRVLMNTSSPLTAGWLSIAVASDNYNAIVLKDTGTSYSTGNYYQVFTNSSNDIAGAIMHLTASTIGLFTGPSDQRLKSNIKDVKESVLPLFNDVKLKTFNHIADKDESVVYKGFLAQDMVDKFPEAYGLDKEGYYAFNPNGYVPYLVKAISELKAEIEELKAKIK